MEDENIARIAGQLHDSQLLMTVDPSGTHELLDPLICVSDQPGAVSLLNGQIEFTCQFRSSGKRVVLDRGAQITEKLYGIRRHCCLRR